MGEKIDNLIKLGACISSLVNNGEDIKVIELPHDEQQAISPIKNMDGLEVIVPPPIVPGVVLPFSCYDTNPMIDLTHELPRVKNRGKSNRKEKVVSKRKRNMVKQSKRKNRKRKR